MFFKLFFKLKKIKNVFTSMIWTVLLNKAAAFVLPNWLRGPADDTASEEKVRARNAMWLC